MKHVRNRGTRSPRRTPLPRSAQQSPSSQRPSPPKKRRTLKRKPLLLLLGMSSIFNILLLIILLWPSGQQKALPEQVASIGKVTIDRSEWMNAMEREIGRDTLQRLVNEKVMQEAAKKYGLTVKDEEVELELALLTATDRQLTIGGHEETLRQTIKSTLILEKVLTNDVIIDDEKIEAYYKENESLYNVPASYRTSAIIVATEDEAKETIQELQDGSNFELLAKERSLDAQSSNLGGDLGYINRQTDQMDEAIVKTAESLKVGTVSQPFRLSNGQYAVIQVTDTLKEKTFALKEVQGQIKRVLAMEQLSQNVRPESFWKEFKVKWIYDE